jgi:hypothetical protein
MDSEQKKKCPFYLVINHSLGITRLCIAKGEYREEFVGEGAYYCSTDTWVKCPRKIKYSTINNTKSITPEMIYSKYL